MNKTTIYYVSKDNKAINRNLPKKTGTYQKGGQKLTDQYRKPKGIK
jgi:hypothetical protein